MLIPLVFGILGLIVGSFLNVLILRHGVRALSGRSRCMACGQEITWFDLIPIASWIALAGRCRFCRATISLQYPLIEAATGILFALVGWWAAPGFAHTPFAVLPIVLDYLAIVSLLIAITVYDLYYTIIPDSWVYTFVALVCISQFLTPLPSDFPWLQFLLAGPAAALPLFALWLVSGGRWMGLGDAKLALGIGWLLGPVWGLFSIFFAFVIGAVVSLCILLPLPHLLRALSRIGITSLVRMQSGFTMKSEIPFGPFLITSCLILWFSMLYGVDLSFIPIAGSP